jgi:hypothetical protein
VRRILIAQKSVVEIALMAGVVAMAAGGTYRSEIGLYCWHAVQYRREGAEGEDSQRAGVLRDGANSGRDRIFQI